MKMLVKTTLAVFMMGSGFAVQAGDTAGFDEPGYVNYNYEISSEELTVADINTLNRVQPTAAGGTGILEPGYLNYGYSATGVENNAKPGFDDQTFKPLYNDF